MAEDNGQADALAPPRVTGPLMARKICKVSRDDQGPRRDHCPGPGFVSGAGDENRTRTISLGIRPIQAPDRPDLGSQCTVSDRYGPYGTMAIGPLMAQAPAGSGIGQDPTHPSPAPTQPSDRLGQVPDSGSCTTLKDGRCQCSPAGARAWPDAGPGSEVPVACLDATGRGCNVRAAHLEQGMARSDRGG